MSWFQAQKRDQFHAIIFLHAACESSARLALEADLALRYDIAAPACSVVRNASSVSKRSSCHHRPIGAQGNVLEERGRRQSHCRGRRRAYGATAPLLLRSITKFPVPFDPTDQSNRMRAVCCQPPARQQWLTDHMPLSPRRCVSQCGIMCSVLAARQAAGRHVDALSGAHEEPHWCRVGLLCVAHAARHTASPPTPIR